MPDQKNPICNNVLVAIRRITRAIDLHSKDLVRNYGITGPQLLLMQHLSGDGSSSAGDIAKRIHLSNATTTEIINRLEKRVFIERKRSSQDKRQVFVSLTPLGQEVLKNAPSPLQERFVSEFVKLEEWEQNTLLSSLQRIASMMEAKEIEASPILTSGAITQPLDEEFG
ncbi:MAG: MarR family winged helix-turn-helix transcriptional regulator [Candidatus Hinthialibacter antarcticus]|nr:MarR family winged helix-turn-helix transcriptional regulator [Candidatus Hinthialibacter antarcticus]